MLKADFQLDINSRFGISLLAMVILVTYVAGMFTDIMQVDAAQYAFMSWEMLDNGEFLQVKYRGGDYLDKPPLLFWLSALSFKLFGVNNFAYHLPSVLSMIAASWATYRIGVLQFNERTGRMAGLMVAACVSTFVINQDCKTDNLLIGGVAMAAFQLVCYLKRKNRWSLVGLGLCLSWGLLAKGPLGIIVPGSAFFGWLVASKQWKVLLSFDWLIPILVIAAALAPMIYGLYLQHGLDGPAFYFYKQSFGRITGASEWQNDTDPFFFIHTFLWAFAPFVVVLLWKITKLTQQVIKKNWKAFTPSQLFNLAGFILPFAALSMSRFKLPHYVFVVIPFASVLTANFLDESSKSKTWLRTLTAAVAIIGTMGIMLFNTVVFPALTVLPWLGLGLILIGGFITIQLNTVNSLFSALIITLSGIFLSMNTGFYPQLLQYQTQSDAGRQLLEQQIPKEKIYHLGYGGNALYYYAQNPTLPMYNFKDLTRAIAKHDEIWVYTREDHFGDVAHQSEFKCDTLFSKPEFRVALLSIPFLNPSSRVEHTKQTYLLHYSK